MIIDTRKIISITEANQNFSKIAHMVDASGSVVIMKNNAPKYVLIERLVCICSVCADACQSQAHCV